mmetsp:Transcript_37024/g.47210  ORF Transcript_37024/g.47210 Transcript_37024/m.47210 type:complete len:112 (-) Transcript_37024:832-1167(-)
MTLIICLPSIFYFPFCHLHPCSIIKSNMPCIIAMIFHAKKTRQTSIFKKLNLNANITTRSNMIYILCCMICILFFGGEGEALSLSLSLPFFLFAVQLRAAKIFYSQKKITH